MKYVARTKVIWQFSKNLVLAPFNEAENEKEVTVTLSTNALVNKIALMAHLLTHPDAETYWTLLTANIPEEHRPAALDQQVPFRIGVSQKLISIALPFYIVSTTHPSLLTQLARTHTELAPLSVQQQPTLLIVRRN